jgi:hypothetical protein
MPVSRETSDAVQACKAKDEPKFREFHALTDASSSRAFPPPDQRFDSCLPSCIILRETGFSRMPAAPEADPRFNEFIILQAQNAGLFLGQIPNPHSGEKQVNLRAAKSVIDSLEMLASKTRGNLTPSEEKLLATALDNLRPLFQAALASADH